ncbi:TIGR02444 family protein [Stutzerimonas stutzeri]|uniref:TIGR02444 family protein n=1 Tax=Stutzerimonas stutzeri TaxID=316 RepID=UPI001C2DF16D|nr:TIGR02444 family protein [Stutzerimonas stutzeri]
MTDDDLWSFALACYAQPGVEDACLELQAAGADVCLLLTAAWLEHRHAPCNEERLERLTSISTDWQALVVTPLRTLRQRWRLQAATDDALANLRMQVKQLELDAERVQLQRLASVAQHWLAGSGSSNWLEPLCSGLTGETRAAVQRLRHAARVQPAAGDD